MMLSPKSIIIGHENDSFEELIKLRDSLYDRIKELEPIAFDKTHSDESWHTNPNPAVRYQVNIEYFMEICQFIKKKYYEEYVCNQLAGSHKKEDSKSRIRIINGSCAEQTADVVVNAANRTLSEGGGICGVIFRKAGSRELAAECIKHKTPLKDGEAVITSSCNMTNFKAIIHAVGPDFSEHSDAFKELYEAYFNSLAVLKNNGFHSISFPLISAGIFGGNLPDAPYESAKQCCRAYRKFVETYPDYPVSVLLCAYSNSEFISVEKAYKDILGNI